MKESEFAKSVVTLVGGYNNIINVFNCYTRVRINVRKVENADVEKIKKLDGVIGVVTSGVQIQIIVGPGKSVKCTNAINQLLEAGTYVHQEIEVSEAIKQHDAAIAATNDKEKFLKNKEGFRSRLNGSFNATMKKIAGIFVPIIPAFIACGLLLATLEIVKGVNQDFAKTVAGKVFDIVSGSVFGILGVVVGYNACKEFGGDGILGACLAGIIYNPLLGDIENPLISFGPINIYSGLGGIISVIFAAIAAAYFEKLLRKFMPNIVDAFLTPFLTLIVMSMVTLFALMPFGGLVSKGIELGVKGLIDHAPYLLGLVPMFYLPLVLFGVHHALIPISQQLIDSTKTPTTPGYSIVTAVQLMGGAAEVGAAIYFIMTTKNKAMKKTVIQALPIGFLGIDEPLVWGMTFPLRRLFIPIGIAGGIMGAVLASVLKYVPGFIGGAMVPETTGIEASLLMSNNNAKWVYAVVFIGAIILGFIFAALFGYKENFEEKNEITGETKTIVNETSLAKKLVQRYKESRSKAY